MAMGSGTDVALEAADIALLRADLNGVADAIELSGRAVDAFLPVLGEAYFRPWRRANEVFWRTAP